MASTILDSLRARLVSLEVHAFDALHAALTIMSLSLLFAHAFADISLQACTQQALIHLARLS